MAEKVSIGRIRGYHGLKGYVRMQPYFDFPGRVKALSRVYVEEALYTLEDIREAGQAWLVKFEGLNTREEAEVLQGKEVRVPQEERFPLPSGHFYVDDLVGMEVYQDTGRFLGRIKEVLKTGANDVYVIQSPPDAGELPKEILFPALKHLVVSFELQEKKAVVRIPEGLL